MRGLDGAAGEVPWVVNRVPVEDIETECAGCLMNTYRLGFEFGFDGSGPWGTLGCSHEECGAHEAVRPMWSEDRPTYREDELLGVLLDFAEDDGWIIEHGAWCPAHAAEA